jgi:signal transduction histidine kinase
MNRRSLRSRIALGLSAYSVLLAVTIILVGYSVHESVEWMVWHAQLDAEMASFLQQRALQPGAELPRSSKLRAYVETPGSTQADAIPAQLRALATGLHDEILVNGEESAVMVREHDGQRIYMVINISALENDERVIGEVLLVLGASGLVVLILAIWWLSGRLLSPVTELSAAVDRLDPGGNGGRIHVEPSAALEVQAIARAMNRLLDRMDELVERERGFVHTASHELRTPIAAVSGAASIALEQPGLPAAARKPLQRISRSAIEMEQLIHMLLVLAKSPERLAESAEDFRLDELLPEIIDDHQHLIGNKEVLIEARTLTATSLHAPLRIAQIAIANLLRNAIENTARGSVYIDIEPAAVLRIQDTGPGMNPEEISAHFAASARAERARGHGIGLDLIARICAHLGWNLSLRAPETGGTLAILDLRASLLVARDRSSAHARAPR